MALELTHPPIGQEARGLPFLRGGFLFLVLLAEVLLLTLRYDTGALSGNQGWWADFLANSPLVLRVGIATAAAFILFGQTRWTTPSVPGPAAFGSSPLSWFYFLGHLAAFLGFAHLTGLVLEGNLWLQPNPEIWVGAWLGLGGATLGLWLAAGLPPSLWGAWVRRRADLIVVGLAIGLATCVVGWIAASLWQPLSQSTLWAVRGMLTLTGHDVVCRPAEFLVGTPYFAVTIAPSCSGYEGMGLIWVFLAAYLWFFRHDLRFPQALLLIPLGTAVMWLANAVRIAALVWIGSWGAPAVAMGGFHSQAGWLAFNGVALGLVVLARQQRLFGARSTEVPVIPQGHPAAPFLTPWLVLMAAMLITSAFSTGFDWLYPLRVLAVAAALWCFRRSYAQLRWSWSWSAVALGVAVFALWMGLEAWMGPGSTAGESLAAGLAGLSVSEKAIWLAFRVAGSVVAVPLAEELAFRGYLTRRLINPDFQSVPLGRFSWFSFLASSLLFGLLHDRWLAGTLAGLVFALALYRRRQLADAVVAHATANALIAACVLGTGTWSLWN